MKKKLNESMILENNMQWVYGGESCQAHHHIFSRKTSFAVK